MDCFIEGPSFDSPGSLRRRYPLRPHFPDFARRNLVSLIIEYDGWPIGLKIAPDGRVLVADYMNGLMELDPQRDTISPLLGHRNCESFRGCNDLHIATNGDIYFTIRGKLDCTIRPAGCSDCVLTAGSIA
ncbi:sugar lactone lactonase YvrE [Bradyrhizobium sp. GM0.4]